MNELHSSLAKCGVFVLPKVLEETRTTGKTSRGGDMFYTRLKINFGFYAEDGSHVDAVVIGGQAMDAMARQPEMQGKLQSSMIVAAALVEGATFLALIISLLTLFV